MTVLELKAILADCNDDAEVWIHTDLSDPESFTCVDSAGMSESVDEDGKTEEGQVFLIKCIS